MGVFSSFGYHVKEGAKGIFRNSLVNTAAVALLIACLLVTGAFALLVVNINSIIEEMGAANEISVFLDESCTDEQAERIGSEIIAVSNVSGVSFISKDEGLESLREEFGQLLDGLENDNPIRDSYTVIIEDQAHLGETVAELQNIAGIVNINYNNEVAQRFLSIRNTIALVGASFVVVLGLLSVFIIANSVRVSAFTRRTEITIMKTVGATNGFIRASFIMEGLIIGAVGAVVAYTGIWLVYVKWFEPAVKSLSFIRPMPFEGFMLWLIAALGTAGPLMGFLGSALALRRYLNK